MIGSNSTWTKYNIRKITKLSKRFLSHCIERSKTRSTIRYSSKKSKEGGKRSYTWMTTWREGNSSKGKRSRMRKEGNGAPWQLRLKTTLRERKPNNHNSLYPLVGAGATK